MWLCGKDIVRITHLMISCSLTHNTDSDAVHETSNLHSRGRGGMGEERERERERERKTRKIIL